MRNILITGPLASGKTTLAYNLAQGRHKERIGFSKPESIMHLALDKSTQVVIIDEATEMFDPLRELLLSKTVTIRERYSKDTKVFPRPDIIVVTQNPIFKTEFKDFFQEIHDLQTIFKPANEKKISCGKCKTGTIHVIMEDCGDHVVTIIKRCGNPDCNYQYTHKEVFDVKIKDTLDV